MRHSLAILIAVVVIAVLALPAAVAQKADQADVQLKAAIQKEVVDGDLKAAIELYNKVAQSSNRAVAARALVRMGQCYEKLGKAQASEARKAYERVVREFADQKEAVEQARALLAAGGPNRQPDGGLIIQQKWVLPSGQKTLPRHVSADGRYIPYEASNGVWLHDLTTGEDRKVIDGKPGTEAAGSPNLSPDGRLVAYWWWGPGGTNELRIAGVTGSDVRVLMKDQRTPPLPKAWSPDGQGILILQRNAAGDFSLAVVSVADGAVRMLTTKDYFSNGCFSPDSRFVVAYRGSFKGGQFVRAAGGLVLLPVDGSAPIPLFESPATNWNPFWAPDGRSIVFLSDRSGTVDLWSVRMSGNRPQGDPELVMHEAGMMDADPIGFTRDGLFYYKTSSVRSDIYTADLDPTTGRITSKPALQNKRFVGSVSAPVEWSPDGQFLVYVRVSRRELGYAVNKVVSLVVRSDRTGEEREIVPVPAFTMPPGPWVRLQWFPDGRSLLTSGYAKALLRQTDVQTGQSRVFLDLSDRASLLGVLEPTLSPDGKALYCTQLTRKVGFQLMRRNLETGEEKELYRSPIVSGASLSPDGRELVFTRADKEEGPYSLIVTPADGGPSRELLRSETFVPGAWAWIKDSRHLLTLRQSKASAPIELWSVPIDGGEPQPSGLAFKGQNHVSVHPDGRRVAFSMETGPVEEVWVIKNLLSAPEVPRK